MEGYCWAGHMQPSQIELGNPGLGQLVLSITCIDFTSSEYEFPKNYLQLASSASGCQNIFMKKQYTKCCQLHEWWEGNRSKTYCVNWKNIDGKVMVLKCFSVHELWPYSVTSWPFCWLLVLFELLVECLRHKFSSTGVGCCSCWL
jgi:hypothetical protein